MVPHAESTLLYSENPVPVKGLSPNGFAETKNSDPRSSREDLVGVSNHESKESHTATVLNGEPKEHPVASATNGEMKETLEPTHHTSPHSPLQLRGVLNDFIF